MTTEIYLAFFTTISTVEGDIKNVIKCIGASEKCNVHVKYLNDNEPPNQRSFLDHKKQYKIDCQNSFYLNTENKYPVVIKGDLFLDVGIANDMLSSIYDDKHELSSENIKLISNQDEINDNKQPLIELGKNVKFVLNTVKEKSVIVPPIKVNFIFNDSSEEKFDSFSESFPINSSISTVSDFIRKKFKVENELKIDISYVENDKKFIIDVKMTLEDIQEEMKQPGKRPKNLLYIVLKRNKFELKKKKFLN